jgi:Undecaprenyl-phosphate galactose phosphotransferase WbaP
MEINQSHQLTFTESFQRARPLHWMARMRMALILALTDAVGLILASTVALVFWSLQREDLILGFYVDLIPLVIIFLGIFLVAGLYSSPGMSPVEELQRISKATSFTFLTLGSLSFFFHNAQSFSRASYILSWLISLALLPYLREVVRSFCASRGWWGEPVAIIGMGDQGEEILSFLTKNPKLGFLPLVAIHEYRSHYLSSGDIPVLKAESLSDDSVELLQSIRTAILIQPEISENFLRSIIDEYGLRFSQLILISNPQQFGSLWVTPCDIGGVLGLRIHQNLFSRWQQTVKRILDISIILLLSPFLFILMTLVAALVKADSRGAVIFFQERIGQNGKRIKVLKFRTMYLGSEAILRETLKKNPAMRREWNDKQKLARDPRVTRVGRLLRKFSLDELPQVINVIKGEMSLVGPRPIVDSEVHHYGVHYNVYLQVKPGLTGLWQVSGRNNLSYPERVRLDDFYVRNWSIWFDFYILSRTPIAMVTGNGAF